MRTSPTPLVARPAWYDRNPVQKVYRLQELAQSPHTLTKKKEYVCPSGKKAMVEFLSLHICRVTAASSAGIVQAYWALQPSGESSTLFMACRMRKNNVGDSETVNAGTSLMLLAGDKLQLYTEDTSTGGTCDYVAGYKITEFDA